MNWKAFFLFDERKSFFFLTFSSSLVYRWWKSLILLFLSANEVKLRNSSLILMMEQKTSKLQKREKRKKPKKNKRNAQKHRCQTSTSSLAWVAPTQGEISSVHYYDRFNKFAFKWSVSSRHFLLLLWHVSETFRGGFKPINKCTHKIGVAFFLFYHHHHHHHHQCRCGCAFGPKRYTYLMNKLAFYVFLWAHEKRAIISNYETDKFALFQVIVWKSEEKESLEGWHC